MSKDQQQNWGNEKGSNQGGNQDKDRQHQQQRPGQGQPGQSGDLSHKGEQHKNKYEPEKK